MDDPTRRARRRDALIADALVAVVEMLRAAPRAARVRELVAQARSYDLAVKHWTAVPPSKVQLDAMFDLVTELHATAVAAVGATRRTKSSGGR